MKKKATAKALTMSILSMLLCLSMLIGTTFAWFTDSVTSGVNKIVAGNLDVNVYYTNDPTNEESWQPVTAATKDLFKTIDNKSGAEDLWEPGHMEVVYLKVVNEGKLALKYQISVAGTDTNTPESVEGNTINLSQYLTFGHSEPSKTAPTAAYTRDTALAVVKDLEQGLGTYTGSGELKAGEADYVSLVVYMPETVGNAANSKDANDLPSIDLMLTVLATQLTYEKDSFDQKYDQDAIYPMPVLPATEGNMTPAAHNADNKIESFSYTGSGMKATFAPNTAYNDGDSLPALSIKPTEASAASAEITAAGLEAVAYEIKITDSDGKVLQNTGKTTFTLSVGKNLQGVKMYHDGTEMTKAESAEAVGTNQYYYDSAAGTVTFLVTSFSEFAIAYEPPVAAVNNVGYYTLADAIAAAKAGDTVKLVDDVTLTSTVKVQKDLTLDLGGHTVTVAKEKVAITAYSGNVMIQNGTIRGIQGAAYGVINAYDAATVTINADANVYGVVVAWGDGTYGEAGCKTPTLNVYGKITNTNQAISTSGNDYSQPNINIYEGAEITSTESAAMYIPLAGTVNISGGTITGKSSAIGIKGGTLNISGGKLLATGEDQTPTEGWSNGINASGAAIQIESNEAYKLNATTPSDVNINITGGTIESKNGHAIYEYIGTSVDSINYATQLKSLHISGGTLIGAPEKGYIMVSLNLASTAYVVEITGGSFSSDPSRYYVDEVNYNQYVPDGYSAIESNGIWTVKAN